MLLEGNSTIHWARDKIKMALYTQRKRHGDSSYINDNYTSLLYIELMYIIQYKLFYSYCN